MIAWAAICADIEVEIAAAGFPDGAAVDRGAGSRPKLERHRDGVAVNLPNAAITPIEMCARKTRRASFGTI